MNDYLCAVLLNETYNHRSKYNDIMGEGEHLKKDLKARIPVVRYGLFAYISFAILLAEIESKLQSLLQLIRKEVSNLFADIKSNNLLNHRTGCFKTHLPTMSQSRKLKLNGGKYGRELSLGGRGFLSTFPLPASNLNLTKVIIKTTN